MKSIGSCGNAELFVEFRGEKANLPMIESLREDMESGKVAAFKGMSDSPAYDEIALFMRNTKTRTLQRLKTSDYNGVRCIKRNSEKWLALKAACGGSGCRDFYWSIFSVNRWTFLREDGATSEKQVNCEWKCLTREFGAAFEAEDDKIDLLLERGAVATFETAPKKKRRLPTMTLPSGKECDDVYNFYSICVVAQISDCRTRNEMAFLFGGADFANLNYLQAMNAAFDSEKFEQACHAACDPKFEPVHAATFAAQFCSGPMPLGLRATETSLLKRLADERNAKKK